MSSYHSHCLLLYQSYKLDCCITNTDAHVTGGSEDGFIFFWDLVDASVATKFRAHSSVVKPSFLRSLLFFHQNCVNAHNVPTTYFVFLVYEKRKCSCDLYRLIQFKKVVTSIIWILLSINLRISAALSL